MSYVLIGPLQTVLGMRNGRRRRELSTLTNAAVT
jgi:hypothetical protein